MALFEEKPTRERPTRGGSSSTTSGRSSSTGGRRKGTPLGVPKDYVATPTRYDARYAGRHPAYLQYMPLRPGAASETVEQAPRYFDGDEWKPASRPPNDIVEMQQKLVVAGYLDANDGFALGRWDGATRKAYQFLLEDANAAGLTADTMLYRAAQSVPIGGGGGGEDGGGGGRGGGYTIDPETGEVIPIPEEQFVAPPLQLQTPNLDDVRRTFRSASVEKLGLALSPEQVDQMAREYIRQYEQVQRNAYQQEVARLGQEFNYERGRGPAPTQTEIRQVEAPSPETFAENELRRRDLGGYQATQVGGEGGYAEQFFAALGSRV